MKGQAEIYRRGLLLGLFKKSEVIAWCDTIIMAEAAPDLAIIQASMAGSKGVNAVAQALAEVPGDYDRQVVIAQLLAVMRELLRQDRTQAPNVARWLYEMAMDDNVPDATARADMVYFWDTIDLALNGVLGDVEALTGELLQFLNKYAAAVCAIVPASLLASATPATPSGINQWESPTPQRWYQVQIYFGQWDQIKARLEAKVQAQSLASRITHIVEPPDAKPPLLKWTALRKFLGLRLYPGHPGISCLCVKMDTDAETHEFVRSTIGVTRILDIMDSAQAELDARFGDS